jgi:4'-phosphopantetheinyl transferase
MAWIAVRVTDSAGDQRARAARELVRTAADLLGADAAGIRMVREPSGRPRLTGAGAGLHVSVSHTGGAVAVAVAVATAVGVDIERERTLPCLPLARRWMTEADAEWLASRPADRHTAAFLWLWTQKEAIGKARGTGLRGGGLRQPLSLPTVWPDPLRALPPRDVPGAAMTVACGLIGGGLVLAVAGYGSPPVGDGVALSVDPPRPVS